MVLLVFVGNVEKLLVATNILVITHCEYLWGDLANSRNINLSPIKINS